MSNSTLIIAGIAVGFLYLKQQEQKNGVDIRKASTSSLMAMTPGPYGRPTEIKPPGVVKRTIEGPNFNIPNIFRTGDVNDFDGWRVPHIGGINEHNIEMANNRMNNPINKGSILRFDNNNVRF